MKKKLQKQAVKNVSDKKEPNLNLAILSKNITQKLQNILATPSLTDENKVEKPVISKIRKTKIRIIPKVKPVQKVLNKRSKKIKKKVKRLETKKETAPTSPVIDQTVAKLKKITGLNIANLKKQLAKSLEEGKNEPKPETTLRDKMMSKLSGARFRFLNEQMYTSEGSEAQKIFKEDPSAFQAYHEGYRMQVEKWPLNPLDKIISSIKNMYVIIFWLESV